MISEAETNSLRRKSAETLKQHQEPQVHRDGLEDDEFVNKVCRFELISRGKNSPTAKSPTSKSPGKINITSPDPRSGRRSGENFPFPQGYVGEKLFSKDTATTRVSASLLQGKSPSKEQTDVHDINANSIGSFGSVSIRRKSGESRNSGSSLKLKSSVKHDDSSIQSPRILGTGQSEDVFFNASVSPMKKTALPSSPFQSYDKLKSSEKFNLNQSFSETRVESPKVSVDFIPSAGLDKSVRGDVKVNGISSGKDNSSLDSDSSGSRNTFDGLDLDFNELTESQKDLTLKHREVVAERKQDQEMERQERQRLEEILSMCADYERQIEEEKVKIKTRPDYHSIAAQVTEKSPPVPPLPIQFQHLQINQGQTQNKPQNPSIINTATVKSKEETNTSALVNQSFVQPPKSLDISSEGSTMSLDRRSDKSDYRGSMTKIMTNGSLTLLSSPSNPHKDFLHGFQIRRAGSNSSNSEEESLCGSSEDTGTIKRRPTSNQSPTGLDRPKSPRTSPRSPIPSRSANQSSLVMGTHLQSHDNKTQNIVVYPSTKTNDISTTKTGDSVSAASLLKQTEISQSSKDTIDRAYNFSAMSFKIEPLRLTNVSIEIRDSENHNSFDDSSHSSMNSEPECDIYQTQDKLADLQIHEPVSDQSGTSVEVRSNNISRPKNHTKSADEYDNGFVRTSEPEALANLNFETQKHRQAKTSKKYHDYVNFNGAQYSDSNSTGSSSSNTLVQSPSNGVVDVSMSNVSPRSSGSDALSSSMENVTPINSDTEAPSVVKRDSVRTSSTGTTDTSSECSWGALEVCMVMMNELVILYPFQQNFSYIGWM